MRELIQSYEAWHEETSLLTTPSLYGMMMKINIISYSARDGKFNLDSHQKKRLSTTVIATYGQSLSSFRIEIKMGGLLFGRGVWDALTCKLLEAQKL
jgi:hypothetical protein